MDQGPLVREKIDAGAKFLKRYQKHTALQAAFWLKPAEDGRWNLYIWSEKFSDENYDQPYLDVWRVAKTLHDPNFDPFEVKVLRRQNQLAQAAIDIYKRNPSRIPAHFGSRMFGGISVDGVYVYPPPAAAIPREKIPNKKGPAAAEAKRSRQ